MFIHTWSHNRSHHRSPKHSRTTVGTSGRGPIRRRLALALRILAHGEKEPEGVRGPLDPRIVAGIDRHADHIAQTYDDPLAGSFARDIMTESAYLIVDSFTEPDGDLSHETAETPSDTDLLTTRRRGRA